MAFNVIIRQRPAGMPAMLTQVEMSMDTLQLKLVKDIQNVMTINGASVNLAQKTTLRKLGEHYEVTNVETADHGRALLVTGRREGFMREWIIDAGGGLTYADGQGDAVSVPRMDPLTSPAWGA